MLAAAGQVAVTVGRFARRHRRPLVLGGIAGAAVVGYWRVRRLWRVAEALERSMRVHALEEERFRRYLARARSECLTAVLNFLPTLRKRLFEAIDVNGPVRELKRLRRESSSRQNNSLSPAAAADADSSALPPFEEDPREAELWEEVKVTGLARLVAALYLFSALSMMLRLQLHILGRHSFEEWLQMFRADLGGETAAAAGSAASSLLPAAAATGGELAAVATAGTSDAAATDVCGSSTGGEGGLAQQQQRQGNAGVAQPGVSMEARHAFLSSTFEYMLGDGLKALVKDVQKAVRERTAHWQMHKTPAVTFPEFVAALQGVRSQVEGPPGGQPGALLLPYIICPREFGSGNDSAASDRDTGAAVQGMLSETWDAAESPNFGYGLSDTVDAVFDVVLRRVDQGIFTAPPADAPPSGAAGGSADIAGEGQAGREETAGRLGCSGRGGAGVGSGDGGGRGGDGSSSGTDGERVPVAEDLTAAQVAAVQLTPPLATAVSQLKAVVAEMLDASEMNPFSQAVSSLESVAALCHAVFGQITSPA